MKPRDVSRSLAKPGIGPILARIKGFGPIKSAQDNEHSLIDLCLKIVKPFQKPNFISRRWDLWAFAHLAFVIACKPINHHEILPIRSMEKKYHLWKWHRMYIGLDFRLVNWRYLKIKMNCIQTPTVILLNIELTLSLSASGCESPSYACIIQLNSLQSYEKSTVL